MRGATKSKPQRLDSRDISIHAPLAGCDSLYMVKQMIRYLFQSTHPLRGATIKDGKLVQAAGDFNPRTPCGVRLISSVRATRSRRFQSTHPLRGATLLLLLCKRVFAFQSTHPLRGATGFTMMDEDDGEISIHAPLAGCDAFAGTARVRHDNFNPRTPCGVRLERMALEWRQDEFQSTHPLRGATWGMSRARTLSAISIHAPLAGCDTLDHARRTAPTDFNPRTPCGVRRGSDGAGQEERIFQSTHPLRGATAALNFIRP